MFKTFINAFKVKEIRTRILFTFCCLIVVRLGSLIVAPGISPALVGEWKETMGQLDFLNVLTGGSLEHLSIFTLSISPYINASIIMQLLTIAIPKLEEMSKDGEDGREKINKISRYLTIFLAVIESTAMAIGFGGQNVTDSARPDFTNKLLIVLAFTAGTTFLMWLGERITERGIGNGISIIVLINIIARLPQDINKLVTRFVINTTVIKGVIGAIVILAVLILMVALIVVLQDAERRIPVQYAKKVQGRKMVGGQASSIPLKVNTSGVIPVIFAMSLLQFPVIISSFFGAQASRTGSFWQKVLYLISQQNWFRTGEGEFKYTLGVLIYIALIIFFAFFYTAVTFNPIEIANNLKKQSGFIPGIRPGKPTSDYLTEILNRIIFIGAISLSVVAIIPIFFNGIFTLNVSFAATSIIIVVGVILETLKQIESMMAVRHYTGFLDK